MCMLAAIGEHTGRSLNTIISLLDKNGTGLGKERDKEMLKMLKKSKLIGG